MSYPQQPQYPPQPQYPQQPQLVQPYEPYPPNAWQFSQLQNTSPYPSPTIETPKSEGYTVYEAHAPVMLKVPTPLVDNHRRTPLPSYILVAVSWLLGLLFAISHHLFNAGLRGTAVNPTDARFVASGTGSSQSWHHGQAEALLVGNVFAQLVLAGPLVCSFSEC